MARMIKRFLIFVYMYTQMYMYMYPNKFVHFPLMMCSSFFIIFQHSLLLHVDIPIRLCLFQEREELLARLSQSEQLLRESANTIVSIKQETSEYQNKQKG